MAEAEAVTLILLFAASVYDVRTGKIPNVLAATGGGIGLLLRFWEGQAGGLGQGLFAAGVVLGVGFFFFLFRLFGAGDIKLWAMVGCLNGLRCCVRTLVLALVLAAVISLIKMWKYRMGRERLLYAWNYFVKGTGKGAAYYDRTRDGTACTVALAPVTAAAYVLVLLERGWM